MPRAALWKRLDEALAQGSVAVTAPAGSGKTHLLSQWWHRAGAGSRAWLTLDDADRDPATFLHSLLQAVRRVETGERALDGLRPPSAEATDVYLRDVGRALSKVPEPVVVVLDDLHRLADSPAETLLATMLRASPEPLHLALLSRGIPRLGLDRARFAGWLDHLAGGDLDLTSAEVAELVRLRAPEGSALSANEVWGRTRGWVLGTLVEIEQLPPGRSRTLLEDFFDTEVLTALSADRYVVERAVTADPVCGRLVDALTGQDNGGDRLLEQLHHAGVFLEPSGPDDDRCAWYRWQPQFRAVLAGRLARHDPRLAQALHEAAARWLRAEGRTCEAAHHALSAGHRDEAAEVLARDWLTLLHTGRAMELDGVLVRFTEAERAARGELAAACAVIRAVENDLTRSCRCAEQAMTSSGPRAGERRLTIEAASAGVHLHRAILTGVANQAPETARRLLDRLDPTRGPRSDSELALRSHLANLVGAWDVHRLELDEAQRLLSDAHELATRLEDRSLVLRSEAQLARVDANSGRLTRALERARTVLDAPAAAAAPQATVAAEIATAEVLLLRGQPLDALAHLTAAQRLTPTEDIVSRVAIAILSMIALIALGRVSGAREQLEVLRSELPGGWSAVPVLEDQLRVAEARQLLAEGSAEAALRVLPESTLLGPATLRTRVETARAWARHLLRVTAPEAPARDEDGSPSAPDRIAATVLDCLAQSRSGDADSALRTLERALRRSAEEKVALPFLLVAAELRPLLGHVVAAGTAHEDWALQLLETMAGPPTPAQLGVPYVEPLTPRELEVLRALQGTLTPEDVAERLFVSMNTLRTHVKHINRKLGTSTRREAVARARELALL